MFFDEGSSRGKRNFSGKGDDRGDRFGGKGKKRKPRRMGFRKKRPPATLGFDYKDVHSLMPFLTEEGKIVPARVSGLRASQQRQLTLAVKRARNVALISTTRRESVSR